MKHPITKTNSNAGQAVVAALISIWSTTSFAEQHSATLETAKPEAAKPKAVTPQTSKQFNFVLGAGITVGGDDLLSVSYRDGDSDKLKAGELLDLKIGGQYRPEGAKVSLQATIGFHFDSVDADNGDASFSRMPLDLLAFYHKNQHRFGLGGTYHSNTELDIDIDILPKEKIDFKNSAGWVVEYGYRFEQSPLTLALRGVKIEYKEQRSGLTASGDHIGVYAYLNF